MSTYHIVNLVFAIITGVYSLFMIHFFIIGVIGIFKRKRFPKSNIIGKYAIVISARNEEDVIGNIIKSIRSTDYPQDKLHIFVIAHNCTDKTASIAKALGATVYEYNNENEKTLGYALKYLYKKIKEDYPSNTFDGYIRFDADNTIRKNYFSLMNDAFQYYQKKRTITSYRDFKVAGKNYITDTFGFAHMLTCYLFSRGRTVTDCSTRMFGPGHLLPPYVVKDGWEYTSITEDIEFSVDQIVKDRKTSYCDEAEYIDEQPTTVKVMFRQRLRWQRGYLHSFRKVPQLLKTLFSKNTKNRGSVYDMLMLTIPFMLVSFLLFLIQLLVVSLCPLFDSSLTYQSVFLNWEIIPNMSPFINTCYNLFFSPTTGFLIATGAKFILMYVGLILVCIILLIMRGKKYHATLLHKTGVALLWPIFILLEAPIDFVAMINKKVKWKPIPHNAN